VPALTSALCVRRCGDESRKCVSESSGVAYVGLGGVCVKLAGLGSIMGCV